MLVLAVVGLVVGLVVGIAIGIAIRTSSEDGADTMSTSSPPPPVSSTTTSPSKDEHHSVYKRYRFAAVTTDTDICSQIGTLASSLFYKLTKYLTILMST